MSLLAESWYCDELLDLPMRNSSPFSGRTTVGTAESGARSECMDWRRWIDGLVWTLGGEEDRIPVVEVGTGVGYFEYAFR